MISRTDIEDMTDAQDEAPERIWLDIDTFNGAVGFAHPKPHAKGHWPDYIRADLARAKIDRLAETCGYAISQWEDWVRDQFEGTSKFAGAMAEVEATRAAVRDSQFADLARPSQAGDERVADLLDTQIAAQDIIIKRQDVEIARLREALWRLLREAEMDGMESRAGWDCWMHHARAALAAMDTPKGGGDE